MSRLSLPFEQGPYAVTAPLDAALLHGLRRLPRRVQQVFLLNRLDRLSIADIARRFGLPFNTVERHLYQALHSTLRDHCAPTLDAGYWYIHLQNPATTTCERIDFRRWLDAVPAHLEAFQATEQHWRSLLAPAHQLGEDGWYRQGRAALSLGGCSVAIGLGIAALLTFTLWT